VTFDRDIPRRPCGRAGFNNIVEDNRPLTAGLSLQSIGYRRPEALPKPQVVRSETAENIGGGRSLLRTRLTLFIREETGIVREIRPVARRDRAQTQEAMPILRPIPCSAEQGI
jgi:hypothetical protein